jgi:glycosyltransferase involved in cell wall biosynthesis
MRRRTASAYGSLGLSSRVYRLLDSLLVTQTESPVKILYVSPYPPAPDGIGTYTHAFARAARSQGHDVRVVVPRKVQDSSTEVIGALSSRPVELAALRDTVVTWNPDVVHVQFAVAAFGTRTVGLLRWLDMLRRPLPVPLVVTMHEVIRETGVLGFAGRVIYRRIAALAYKIIVHTAAAAAVLIDSMGVPGAKVKIIPHPSARPPVAGSTPEDVRARFGLGSTRILLAFGFIHVDKGLGDLVRALGILRDSETASLSGIRLVVAGAVRPRSGIFRAFEAWDHIYLVRVLHRVRRLSLQRNVVLTGFVPDQDIAAWFQAADAAVLPYRHAEQSGVAGLARAFGLPVLMSTVGGLGEQHADCRWTFPPRSPERLAGVLADFLSGSPSAHQTVPPQQPASDLATIAEATFSLYRTSGTSASHVS